MQNHALVAERQATIYSVDDADLTTKQLYAVAPTWQQEYDRIQKVGAMEVAVDKQRVWDYLDPTGTLSLMADWNRAAAQTLRVGALYSAAGFLSLFWKDN